MTDPFTSAQEATYTAREKAAWAALKARGVSVSLEMAAEAVAAVDAVGTGRPDRAAALTAAVEITEKLAAVPLKANGYAVDGWKAPTLAERTRAIQDLTATLLGEDR